MKGSSATRSQSCPDRRAALAAGGRPILSGMGEGDPLLGTVLSDRYFLRRLVGEGAMGRVYEGHHTGIGKRVAIKIPRQGGRRKREMVQRFRLEAQAASQIRHPNIADVTDCGTTADGRFFFVMEYIDGIDLVELVRDENPLPVERALLIAVQVCRALEAAHKAGIIHRDLKPSNVMLLRDRPHDDGDLVKVLDFGVAKFLRADPAQHGGQLTQVDAAVGTPKYMAPEQIERGNDIDFRVDIYAVGGLLYFLLSGGHPPTDGDTVESVWRQKLTEEALPLGHWRPDIPPAIESLVGRCLARDSARRPASMELLRRELLTAIEGRRSVALTAFPRAPSVTSLVEDADRRSQRRNRAAMLLLGVGGTIAGITALMVDRAVAPVTPQPAASTTSLNAARGGPGATPGRKSTEATGGAKQAGAVGAPYGSGASPGKSEPSSTPIVASLSTPVKADSRRVRVAQIEPGGQKTRPTSFPSGTAETLLTQSEISFQEARFVDAIGQAEKAVKAGAGADAWILLGKIHRQMQDFNAAVQAYEKALELAPRDRRALDGHRKASESLARAARSLGRS